MYEDEFGFESDPLEDALAADPQGFVSDVIASTVEQVAPIIQANVAAAVEGRQAELDQALGSYALNEADRALRAAYGDEWNALAEDVSNHLAANPHLLPRDMRDPQGVADALEAHFFVLREAAKQREQEEAWNRIKANGKWDYWEPAS